MQEELEEQTRRAYWIDSRVQDAKLWSESAREVVRDVDQELDQTRQRMREADQRADEAQAKDMQARTRLLDALSQVGPLRTDLREVGREFNVTGGRTCSFANPRQLQV